MQSNHSALGRVAEYEALMALGTGAKFSDDSSYDILHEGKKIEVKSSKLYFNNPDGRYFWRFVGIRNKSDFHLLVGYDLKRESAVRFYIVPTARMIEALAGESIKVFANDKTFDRYIFINKLSQ